MIERRRPGSFRRLDHDELTAFRRRDAIPKSIIALPRRPDAGSKNQRVGVVTHPLLGTRIIGWCERAWRIGGLLRDGGKHAREDHNRKPYNVLHRDRILLCS